MSSWLWNWFYTVVYLLSIETQISFCNKIFLKLKSLTFGQIKRLGVQWVYNQMNGMRASKKGQHTLEERIAGGVNALTFICRFIVRQKRMIKYITRMGQNTGTLNASKKVQNMAIMMALDAECLKEINKMKRLENQC